MFVLAEACLSSRDPQSREREQAGVSEPYSEYSRGPSSVFDHGSRQLHPGYYTANDPGLYRIQSVQVVPHVPTSVDGQGRQKRAAQGGDLGTQSHRQRGAYSFHHSVHDPITSQETATVTSEAPRQPDIDHERPVHGPARAKNA